MSTTIDHPSASEVEAFLQGIGAPVRSPVSAASIVPRGWLPEPHEPLTAAELLQLADADPAATLKATASAIRRAGMEGEPAQFIAQVALRFDRHRLDAEVTKVRAKRILRVFGEALVARHGRAPSWRETADVLADALRTVVARLPQADP